MNTQDIWNLYSEDLKVFILSKIKNNSITDDILQDVFVKIHTKKSDLKDNLKIKSWIFTIANNTMLDYFKKTNNTKALADQKTSLVTDNKNHDPIECLLPLIIKLPKKYKDVLFLSVIKSLKQQEIASHLKISLSATKSRILRGRELLKQSYMDCCNYTLDNHGHLKGEFKNIEECKVCRPQPE